MIAKGEQIREHVCYIALEIAGLLGISWTTA